MMGLKRVNVKIVESKQPCSACLITGNLVREMMDKISRELGCVDIENIKLSDLKNIHSIKGLEVENFPAIIINGEQITAGSLPIKSNIISIIKKEAGYDEKD
ncbi:MAG: thioredoxin family protein [Clostridiales bacterium]|nr:thioredoxin family protein [Clostridiales bacterium]